MRHPITVLRSRTPHRPHAPNPRPRRRKRIPHPRRYTLRRLAIPSRLPARRRNYVQPSADKRTSHLPRRAGFRKRFPRNLAQRINRSNRNHRLPPHPRCQRRLARLVCRPPRRFSIIAKRSPAERTTTSSTRRLRNAEHQLGPTRIGPSRAGARRSDPRRLPQKPFPATSAAQALPKPPRN